MTTDRLKVALAATIIAGGVLMFVLLSFHWRVITIDVPGANVVDRVTGWHGAGFPLGFFLLALMSIEGTRLWRIAHGDELRLPVASFVCALAALALTVSEFFHGTALTVAGTTYVDTGTRQWPATAGLVVAIAIAVCATAALVASVVERLGEVHAARTAH
jgi:hypothetical protein